MKRYDLTGVSNTLELGKGGPTISNDNGELSFNGSINTGIYSFQPVERTTGLIIDEAVTNCSFSTVSGNTVITQTLTNATGRSRSNATCHLLTGTEYGIYTKLVNPDNGSLATNSDFSVVLSSYDNITLWHTNYLFATFQKQGDNTWSVTIGTNGDTSVVYAADINIHEAEVCTTFEIVNATSAIVNVYVAGLLAVTNTVTVADTSKFKTVHNYIDSASATAMQLAIIATPSSPINGVSQIQSTGEVDTSQYPESRTNKTFQVVGLNYPLLDLTANKVISNGCLVTFDENDNLITSTADENSIVFYLDWNYEELYIQDGDSYWSNGTTASTTCLSGNIALSTRSVSLLTDILTPNGDKLNFYKIKNVRPLIYSDSMWLVPGWIYGGGGGIGTFADYHNGVSIVIQGGNIALSNDFSNTGGGTFGSVTNATSPKPAKIRIVASK